CPSLARDAVWYAGHPALLACARTRHRRVAPRRTAWPQAGGGPVTPSPPAPRPADPPPRLWSAPPGPRGPACAAAPSVSPWPAAGATALPPPPGAPPPDAAHSLRPAPAHRAVAACPRAVWDRHRDAP